MDLIHQMKNRYRIDSTRIYLSGLSMGARVVTVTAAKYPMHFAAIAPMAGVAVTPGVEERCRSIAESGLPVWHFHNMDDPMASVQDAEQFIDLIRINNPIISPRFTIFDVYGHDAWTKALDPEYRENGLNVYEWMLQYNR
jgi:predicted peptidase